MRPPPPDTPTGALQLRCEFDGGAAQFSEAADSLDVFDSRELGSCQQGLVGQPGRGHDEQSRQRGQWHGVPSSHEHARGEGVVRRCGEALAAGWIDVVDLGEPGGQRVVDRGRPGRARPALRPAVRHPRLDHPEIPA